LGQVLEAAGAVLAREHAVKERADAFLVVHAHKVDELLL
jgi:hypothetical protein